MAAFLAIPVIAAEFVARKLISVAVANAVKSQIGVAPTIGFGSSPLLLQIAHGHLDAVTVSAKGARIGGLPPLSVSATLRDVHLRSITSLQGAIGSLTVTAAVPPAGVRDLLATPSCVESMPPGVLAALTRSPYVAIFPGRVDLLPPHGRAAEVRMRPWVAGDSVRFTITGLDLAGAPVSTAALAGARAQTFCHRSLGPLPFGISLRAASAATGALDLVFTGAGASFSPLG